MIFLTPRKTTGKDLLYDSQRGAGSGSGKRRGSGSGGVLTVVGEENEMDRRRSQQRRRRQGYSSAMSPLAIGDMLSSMYSGLSSIGSTLFFPISSIYASYLSYHETAAVVDQSWQRQNIPVFIQPSITQSSPAREDGTGGAGGSGPSLDEIYLSAAEERIGESDIQQSSSPSADSYLMSLLMNHRDGLPLPPLYEEEDEEEESDDEVGKDEENGQYRSSSSKRENALRHMLENNNLYQTKRLPNEIQSITAISSLKATLKKEKKQRNGSSGSSASPSSLSPFNKNYLSYLLSSSFELMDDKDERKKNEKILLSKLKLRKEDDLIGKRRISSNASLSSRTNPLTDDAHPMDHLTPSLTLAPLNESDEHSFEKHSSNEKDSPLSAAGGGGMKEIDDDEQAEQHEEQEFDSRTIHISTITSIKQLKFLFRFMVLEDSSRKGSAGGHGQHHGYYNLYHQSTMNPYIALLRALIIVLYHRPSSSSSSSSSSSTPSDSSASSSINFVNDVIGLSEHLIRVNRHGRPTSTSSLRVTSPTMRRLADSISLDSSQLNTVLEQLLLLYTPAAIPLTMIERQEIIDEFYQFIILNDFNWERIPLSSFMLWFLEMIDKIEKYKKVMKYGIDSSSSSSSGRHDDDYDEEGYGNEGERKEGNDHSNTSNNTSAGQSKKEQKSNGSSSSSSSSYSTLSSSALMKRKFSYTRTYQQLRRAIALPTPSASSMKEEEEKEDPKSAEEEQQSSSSFLQHLTSSPPSFKSLKQHSSRKGENDDLLAGRRPVLVSEISTRSTFEDGKEEEPAFVRPSRSNAVRQSILIPSSPPAPASSSTIEGEQQQQPQKSTYTFAPRQFNKNTPPAPAVVKKESKEGSEEGSPVVVPPPAPVPPVFSGIRNILPVIVPRTNDHEDRATGDFSMGNPLRGLKKKNNTDSPSKK
jgi:hypothetical protein